MEHLGTVLLETERLVLRRFTAEDAPAAFANWTSDDKVTEYLSWPTHGSLAVTEWVLADWIGRYEQRDFYQWAIVPKGLGQPIGTISVVDSDDKTQRVEIGYCIGHKWWRKGYTSEAFSAMIPFLFERVGVNRIEGQHHPENVNSGKVMEKCGLVYEGTLRQSRWCNKGIVDACVYGILASDYEKSKK